MGAFSLFGQLYSIITIALSKDILQSVNYLRDDLHGVIISPLLHTNDENDAVKQAATYSLQNSSSLLNLPEIKYI